MPQAPHLKLNNGIRMPMIGLGTWNASKETVGSAVEFAIREAGYAHIDCAHVYENEKEVGEAFDRVFGQDPSKRADAFITGKLWNDSHAKHDVVKACKKSLEDLRLEYLDLYLMHFGVASPPGKGFEPVDKKGFLVPNNVPVRETWEAMEELVKMGLVKSIGVSNFTGPMLVDLLTYAKIAPAVNQIELHPYNQQDRLIEFCRYHDIAVTAYSPLGSQGALRPDEIHILMQDSLLKEIASHHGKTLAQILLRWGIQRQTIVIPKSINTEHITQNIDIFDFELTEAEMAKIALLDKRYRYVNPYDWWKIPYFD